MRSLLIPASITLVPAPIRPSYTTRSLPVMKPAAAGANTYHGPVRGRYLMSPEPSRRDVAAFLRWNA